MLVKDWDVPFSFDIRYKHLLVNRQGQQESDENTDHILGANSGEEDGSDEDDEDDAKGGTMNDEDDEDVDDEDEDEDEVSQGV